MTKIGGQIVKQGKRSARNRKQMQTAQAVSNALLPMEMKKQHGSELIAAGAIVLLCGNDQNWRTNCEARKTICKKPKANANSPGRKQRTASHGNEKTAW